jgi:phosphoglycerol transferase MdoB-like AlkP superfamily enzyme
MHATAFASTYRRLAILALCYLVVLSASRLVLVAMQFDRVEATGGLGFILLQGLRFDIMLVGLVLGPVAIFKPLFHLAPGLAGIGRWLGAIYVGVMTGLALFIEASTAAFIFEFDSRPNYIFIEYLQYPREVLATVSGERPVELVAFTTLALLAGLGAAEWLRRDPRWATRATIVSCLVAMPLAAALSVAMVRSTLDHRPVNASVAAFSQDSLVNQLPLNSPYTIIYSLYERHRDQDRNRLRYGEMHEDDVLDIVLSEAGIDPDEQLDASVPTLRYQQATHERERPLNLVIILEESLGAKFVGSLGGLDLTPELDSLAEEGIYFERLYATGLRSVRGIEAVLTCITPRPQLSVVKLSETQQNFFTLAGLLENHGYQTSFIYGGESHFDRMREFFLGNGFQSVVDEKDYEDPIFMGSWGVSDEDLFLRAHETFEQAGDRPFFSLVFTSSNHAPFDIPAGRVTESEHGPRATAIQYADYALGEFFDRARASDYWENTVFVVVADHSTNINGGTLVPVEEYRIPGLIIGESIEPRRVPGITSQIDLLPTMLSLIGLSAEHPCIGRDITTPEYFAGSGRASLQFHETQAYVEDDRMVVLRHDMAPEVFKSSSDGSYVPLEGGDPKLAEKALAYALWGPMTIRKQAYKGVPARRRLADERHPFDQ